MSIIQNFPRQGEPITEQGGLISRTWSRFLSYLWATLGYQKSTPVYLDDWRDAMATNYDGEALTIEQIEGGVDGLSFPKDSENKTRASFNLGTNYKESADLAPSIEFIPNADTGICVWRLSYITVKNGAIVSSEQTEEISVDCDGLIDESVKASFPAIDGKSFDNTTKVLASVARLGDNVADTLDDTCILLGVNLRYAIEGLGSFDA